MNAKYIDFESFEDACKHKWAAGVQEYRGGDLNQAFVGEPLAEAYDELVDSHNYLTRAEEMYDIDLTFIKGQVRSFARILKVQHARLRP